MPPELSAPAAQPAVKSALRTLDLIEYVVAHPSGVVAQEISAALAIPVSSLSYLLATLVDRTYLRRDGRRYVPGPGLDRLRRPPEELSLADRARPFIRALRTQVNETSSLFEREGWDVVAVVTETADHTLRYSIDVGIRIPMHAVAGGKALLAALPADDLARYLDEGHRERFTDRTLCDAAELSDQLARIREAGYARTEGEYSIGISAIGMPVMAGDMAVAAVSVAVPSARFTPEVETRIVDRIRRTCAALGSAAA